MTSSQTTVNVSIQELALNYSEPKVKCSCSVLDDTVIPSGDADWQTEASGNNVNLRTIVADSNETQCAQKGQGRLQMNSNENNKNTVNGKAEKDVDIKKNGKEPPGKCEQDFSQARDEIEPPDGGWGYMVIAGAFIIMVINGALSSCFGILFTDFLLEAGGSLSTITALMSTYISVSHLTIILGGILTERWGWRTVVMWSSIFCCSGMVITAFTSSIDIMFVSYSLLTGANVGICFAVATTMPSFYFKRHRGKANAVVLCGTSVGGTVGPLLISFLYSEYGFRGATLIAAAITLHGCLSATVFHPVEWHSASPGNTEARSSIMSSKDQKMSKILTSYWTALKASRTLIYILSYALLSGIFRIFLSLLPLFLEEKGHSRGNAAFMTSICNICGVCCRVVVSSLVDKSWFSLRGAFMASKTIVLLSLIVFSMVDSLLWATVTVAVLGCGFSVCYMLQHIVIVHYMGLKHLMPVLALAGITSAIWLSASIPVYDVIQTLRSDNYGALLLMGSQVLAALILWFFMPMAVAFDKRMKLCNSEEEKGTNHTSPED